MGDNLTTSHRACNSLVDILLANGVGHVVISPGSRNAPLIVALARCCEIKKFVIIDERSAAFVALGIAQHTDAPVALVCTSGSALLNYAPAVAEAYYKSLPLIVISADRPLEWINQDDSQTIAQVGALDNIVKGCYDVPAEHNSATMQWYVNRTLNDALIAATSGRKAPVHINMQLNEPLYNMVDRGSLTETRVINRIGATNVVSKDDIDYLSKQIANAKRVLIVAGYGSANAELDLAIERLAAMVNVVVLTETISNIKCEGTLKSIDRVLSAMDKGEMGDFAPDLLITFGGALVSRIVKQLLRSNRAKEHWHVGITENSIDCMQSLTTRVEVAPKQFLSQLVDGVADNECVYSDYADKWKALANAALDSQNRYIENIEWCDLKAFSILLPMIPKDYVVHLSNGTPIRYSQLFGEQVTASTRCNRGVSGIDGCGSTALGESLVSDAPTLLITGDMSFSYDIAAMTSKYNSTNFKIIVMANGGGGIFRFIKGASDLAELEEYLEVKRDVPIERYAAAFGYDYFSTSNMSELEVAMGQFIDNNAPSILAIHTPSELNAEVLRGYFRRNK
ncbi:MAG: 2-succinyl-5-enolpyruvyl-6-hydroxy-3-cyclohexene-1-carboxylic-acid synthase [Bacteroidales bacterium]